MRAVLEDVLDCALDLSVGHGDAEVGIAAIGDEADDSPDDELLHGASIS
jgi:hypothetical protein